MKEYVVTVEDWYLTTDLKAAILVETGAIAKVYDMAAEFIRSNDIKNVSVSKLSCRNFTEGLPHWFTGVRARLVVTYSL